VTVLAAAGLETAELAGVMGARGWREQQVKNKAISSNLYSYPTGAGTVVVLGIVPNILALGDVTRTPALPIPM
jgi:hypothetical protein